MKTRELSLQTFYNAIKCTQSMLSASRTLGIEQADFRRYLTKLGLFFLIESQFKDYKWVWEVFSYNFIKSVMYKDLIDLLGAYFLKRKYDVAGFNELKTVEEVFPGIIDHAISKAKNKTEAAVYIGCTAQAFNLYFKTVTEDSFLTYKEKITNKVVISDFFADGVFPKRVRDDEGDLEIALVDDRKTKIQKVNDGSVRSAPASTMFGSTSFSVDSENNGYEYSVLLPERKI